jgi:hypothetical protein
VAGIGTAYYIAAGVLLAAALLAGPLLRRVTAADAAPAGPEAVRPQVGRCRSPVVRHGPHTAS